MIFKNKMASEKIICLATTVFFMISLYIIVSGTLSIMVACASIESMKFH